MFKNLLLLSLLVGATLASEEHPQKARGDEEPLIRGKRQIPVPTFPSFGPDVERTADGVPILDESYLERRDRPAARFFSQFEPAETEGLRLYEGLLGGSSGGRPELRSLDGGEDPFGGNGLQSQSGSWTRKTHSRRTSRKSIQVKSAGTTASTNAADWPSGFGPSTGPKFSEEVTYQRSTNANKRRNAQLRSLDGGSNGYSCVTCRRQLPAAHSDEGLGATELKTLSRTHKTTADGYETEGLRLYKKLLRNGGSRNQLRSLDDDDSDIPTNGILPHHRRSAAWSQREEKHESHSQNRSTIQVKSATTPSEIHSGFGPSTGPQFSDEVNYRRSSSGRRNVNRNASRTRSLSSTAQTTSDAQHAQLNGGSSCVTCRTRSSNTLVTDEAPAVTYHRRSRVPSTGDYLIPTAASSSSSSWAEREERSHHSSRTVSRTINGVETNGLGEPLHSEEEATYRRAASGSSHNGASTASTHQTEARQLSAADLAETHSAARAHSVDNTETETSSSNAHHSAATLSVAGLNNGNNGNGRSSRRYNCSRISTTSLSELEGVQSVTDIVTPPPCVVRRSNCRDCSELQTRSRTRSLNLPYPPVQTFGRGDQEVAARVLESDHESDSAFDRHHSQQQQQHHSSASEHLESENHEESSSSGNVVQPTQSSYRTGRKHKKAYYRRTVFKNYTTSEYPASLETWLGA